MKSIDLNIVLDRSGSMASCRNETIQSFNNFIGGQREADGRCDVTLVQFNQGYEKTVTGMPIRLMKELTFRDYKPAGGTALRDAVGRLIDETGERLAHMKPDDRPDQVLVVIITDGYENSSIRYSQERLEEMIRHQRDKYQWKFVFLGADIDAIAAASDIGMYHNAMSYSKCQTIDAIGTLDTQTKKYRESGEKTCAAFFDR